MTGEVRTISKVMAERLRDIRGRRGWSQKELASRMTAIGAPMHQTAIAKIENDDRNVTVENALALAVALGVSPLSILLPEDEDALISIAPAPDFMIAAEYVRRWLCGLGSLPHFYEDHLDRDEATERVRLYESFLPLNRWRAYRHPGVQHLVQLTDLYASAASDDNRVEMGRLLRSLRAEMDRQEAELQEET